MASLLCSWASALDLVRDDAHPSTWRRALGPLTAARGGSTAIRDDGTAGRTDSGTDRRRGTPELAGPRVDLRVGRAEQREVGRCGRMQRRTFVDLSTLLRDRPSILGAAPKARRGSPDQDIPSTVIVDGAAHPAPGAMDDLFPPTVIGKGSAYLLCEPRRSSRGASATLGGAPDQS
jgi:hypothetical protein